MAAVTEAVSVDTHRWYSVITVKLSDGSSITKVIGCLVGGDGLAEYDSIDKWFEENT